MKLTSLIYFLRPQTKSCESNVYCPQHSCGKVMFSQASVILFTGGCLPQCILGYTPQAGTPPWASTAPWAGTPPGQAHHAGQVHTQAGTHPPNRYTLHDGHCSRWYASYWNAFLFQLCLSVHRKGVPCDHYP